MAGSADIGFSLTVDGKEMTDLALAFQGRLEQVIEEKRAGIEKASTVAAGEVDKDYTGQLRADVVAGGFANAVRLSKTWRGAVYPKNAPTLEPAVYLANKAATIVDAFSLGVTITVRGAQFLAIPEGPAKAIVRRMNQAANRSRNAFGHFIGEANPVERVAQALNVKLIPIIDQATGHGVLVADTGAVLTRGGRFAKNQRGQATVLFALVKSATLKKRMHGRALLERMQASFLADYAGALARHLPPEARE